MIDDLILLRAPLGSRLALDLGAPDNGFAEAYLARSPATRLIGIDPAQVGSGNAPAAATHPHDARTEALLGRLDQERAGQSLDAVIVRNGIESLADPRCLLTELRARSTPGAVCLVSAANISHWSVVVDQLQGLWNPDPAENGAPSPVRLFTRQTLIDLLRETGWTIVDVSPRLDASDQTASAIEALEAAATALGLDASASFKEGLSALSWTIRATNGAVPPPLTVAALGMKKVAGVTDARIDHPMSAMASRPSIRAAWGAGGVQVPAHWSPGVLILHRQFMDGPAFVDAIENRIAKGWIVVSEIDDDPAHWPAYAGVGYRAFRGVHAVTVSTERLADVIRVWNPNVVVFPNAVPYIPATSNSSPKTGERLRVFFGALNREADWRDIIPAITEVANALKDRLEFVVVHDRAFFDALGDVTKSFTRTLAYDDYMSLLAGCDIALLPLNDTPFNRLKSDIKLIECSAAGVVPICSPTLYSEDPAHSEVALFAETPQLWAAALRRLATDPIALAQSRVAGLAYVKARRMQVHQIDLREAVFRDWICRADVLEAERQQRLSDSPRF